MTEFLGGLTGWSLADQIICYLFIILFVWGGTNKFGKKGEFNEDFLSLDTMKSLRGFAAIGVIIHHISQEPFFQENEVLSPFVNAGAYFVAIFFFCSGYGLLKSFDTKKDYLKGFIRKRIVKAIVVPFYINVLIYGLFFVIVKYPLEKEQWITNLLGVTMMNRFAWFPIVLAILYLAFYICFRFIKNRPACFIILFVLLIGLAMLFCFEGHYAWWYGPENWWMDENYWMNDMKWWQNEQIFWFSGEWWVNSAPAFLTGLVFANYEKKIVAFFKKNYAIKFHVLLLITMIFYRLSALGKEYFGYWSEWAGKGPAIGDKIKTYFCQLPLFLILVVTIVVFMMKYHVSNPVTRFFGKYSLHTYLMNLAALRVLFFIEVPDALVCVGDVKNNLLIYGACVMILSVLLGVGEQKITDKVQELLFDRKKREPVTPNRTWSLIDETDSKHMVCVRDEVETKPDAKKNTEEHNKQEG